MMVHLDTPVIAVQPVENDWLATFATGENVVDIRRETFPSAVDAFMWAMKQYADLKDAS